MPNPTAPKDKFEALALLPSPIAAETFSLRRVERADSSVLANIIFRNPDIKKYVTWPSFVNNEADVVPALQRMSNQAMDGRYVAVETEGPVFGYIGIFPGEQSGEYGMGYFVDSRYRGRGLASQAVAAMVEAATEVLNPTQLYLQIAPENSPSVAVATGRGFQSAETVWDEDLQLQEQRYRLEVAA